MDGISSEERDGLPAERRPPKARLGIPKQRFHAIDSGVDTPPSALSLNLAGLPDRPTLSRFLDFWLAHIAWSQLRFSTARTYSSVVVNLIAPILGRTRVARLATSDMERAQLLWQQAGVTLWMRRKAIEVLRSALNHAVALGLCEQNVARRASIPAKRPRVPRWLDVAGVRRLLADVHGHPLEPAYVLAIGLGLRRGEIIGLTWADVDLRRGRLTVDWNRVECEHGTRLVAPKTAASRRVLVLPRMRFHDLRHTAASLLLSEGVPPRTVMEMMGHRNLAVTMLIYGHTNLDQQERAVATLDKALRRYRIG